jgi:hypothetical protein
MNNALWSPRGARAGERNRVTGYTGGIAKKLSVLHAISRLPHAKRAEV